MSGVDEIRQGIQVASQKAEQGVAAITEAELQLEDARNTLQTATEGSAQVEVAQAQSALTEAINALGGARASIQAAVASAEAYSARL